MTICYKVDIFYFLLRYRATGLDVVILKEEMGSRGKMGFLARLA